MILMIMLSPSKMMNANRPRSNTQCIYDLFPMTCKFKTILCSSGNKKCLQVLIKTRLSEQSNSISQELIYSVGEGSVNLSTADTKDNSSFNQDEVMLSVYTALRSSDSSDPMEKTQMCTFRLQPFHIIFQVFSP